MMMPAAPLRYPEAIELLPVKKHDMWIRGTSLGVLCTHEETSCGMYPVINFARFLNFECLRV